MHYIYSSDPWSRSVNWCLAEPLRRKNFTF